MALSKRKEVELSSKALDALIEFWNGLSEEEKWSDLAPPSFIERLNELIGNKIEYVDLKVFDRDKIYRFKSDGSMKIIEPKKPQPKASLPESVRRRMEAKNT